MAIRRLVDEHLAFLLSEHYPATRDWLLQSGHGVTLSGVTRAMGELPDSPEGDRRMLVLAWAVGEASQLAQGQTPRPFRPQE